MMQSPPTCVHLQKRTDMNIFVAGLPYDLDDDEFDDEESSPVKVDDNTYIFEGKTMLHDMCKVMKLPIHTFDKVRGESESLAGLVLEVAGAFPEVNEEITVGDFTFVVLETSTNRIKQVKVIIKRSIA